MFAVTPQGPATSLSGPMRRRPLFAVPLWRLAGCLLPVLLVACGGSSHNGEPPVERTTAVIGPAGGTLTGPDGVQVVIPAGALRANTTIGIARTAEGAPAADPMLATPGTRYEFTPHGMSFEVPVAIRLPVAAGVTSPEVWFAGTDTAWIPVEAVVAGGFATVERNTFSWSYVAQACAIPANAPPNPDRCFGPRGGTQMTASPANALVRTSYSNAYINPVGTFRLDAAATLNFSASYSMWPSCTAARVTFYRRQLDRSPEVLETLYDQTLSLNVGYHGDRGAGGAAQFPPVALSHLDRGRHVYATYVACQRGDGFQARYQDAIVINVDVPVPTTTQTIGGTVSGLAGTVVLRNNGADDLTVNASGAFTFATPVATGVPYNVTVGTQPAGQVCTVQNGSGTASANITNVAVTCGAGGGQAWQVASRIEASLGTAQNPVVAVDSTGNATAVWQQHDGTRNNIWASRYTAGGSWSAPQNIESGNGNAVSPAVAVDSAGNATAIWSQHDGTTMSIRSATWSGGSWGADEPVESDNGAATTPHLGVDAGGNVLAVWAWNDGGQQRIRANRRVSGTWQTETSIDGAVGPAIAPEVAVMPGGFALAVWLQVDGGQQHLFHNAFNGTGWSSAQQLVTNTTSSIGEPRIARNDSGGAIVVWAQGTGSGSSSSDVLAARYSGGMWNNPVTLSNVNAQSSFDPRIAMSPTGRAMVVWRESHNDARQTWGQPYSPDGGWAVTATRLDATLDGGSGSSGSGPLEVGIDSDGNAMAVWAHALSGAMHNDLYATRYDATSMTWGTRQLIENTAGGIDSCAVAVDTDGNAIAVWAQDDGSPPHGDIWSNVFR